MRHVAPGRPQAAVSDATRAIELAVPGKRIGYRYGTRRWARADAGDRAGALQDCETAVEQGAGAFDEGMLRYLRGDPRAAVEIWTKLVEKDPGERRELSPWFEAAEREALSEPEPAPAQAGMR